MGTLGRPPVKKALVQDVLRERIVSGQLAPEDRLPTRRALAKEFSATLRTVQHAFDALTEDGFVLSKGKLGTFVTPSPPHLNHVALVFEAEQGGHNWNLYNDHLAAVARAVVQEEGLRLSVYTGVHKHHPGPDYERLLDDLRNDRLAGIIFSDFPFPLSGTEILSKPSVPRVAVMEPQEKYTMVSPVTFDGLAYTKKVVAHLTAVGVRQLAILQNVGQHPRAHQEALSASGIDCPYHFRMGVSLTQAHWAKHWARLLFAGPAASRPDALLVLDDNLFAPALAGTIEAGLSVPEDVAILTHANFPWVESCPEGVTRLGYDMRALLHIFLKELKHQRDGHSPRSHRLAPVLEAELPQDCPSLAPLALKPK